MTASPPPGWHPVDGQRSSRKRSPLLATVIVASVLGYCAALVAVYQAHLRELPRIDEGTCAGPNSSSRYPITATISLGSRSTTVPYGLAVDAGSHTAYVTNHNQGSGPGDTMSVIDLSTRAVAATVPVGKFPWAVGVDPGTHTVYITNTGNATLSVITPR